MQIWDSINYLNLQCEKISSNKKGQYGCYYVTSKREQLHEKMKRHAHARMKYFHIIINGGVWV